jgi:membrane protease YdiL (CAAX protease family)
MSDSPLTLPPPPQPANFFRNPNLPSVFVRLALFLILGEALGYALSKAAYPLLRGRPSLTSPHFLFVVETVALMGSFGAAWLLSALERRPFGDYGLPLQAGAGKHFAQGAIFGLVEISAVLGGLATLGYYHFGSLEVHGTAILRWALIWGLFFVIVGFYEEFAFRGYVQFTLAQAIGFWPAATCLSFLFGAIHYANPGETWPGLAGIVLTGLFWAFTLSRTGTLWFAVGMHATFDFGETFLYSVPDSGAIFPGHLSSATLAGPTWLSGGTAGPEASVFDFLAIIIFFFLFHSLYPAAKSPAAGPAMRADATQAAEQQDAKI